MRVTPETHAGTPVTVDGLEPDTLYAFRVQGGNGWWSPWRQLRTAAAAGAPLEFLYFGDTQNKNASLGTRVVLEAMRHAPEARLALFAGDLVSGGDGEDDNVWGEWADIAAPLASTMLVAPVTGNHEYFEEFEDTPRERRVSGRALGAHVRAARQRRAGREATTTGSTARRALRGARWHLGARLGDRQGAGRVADGVLRDSPRAWTVVAIHQPMYSPREGRDNRVLRRHLMPVLERHAVDLVLQGHDHTYGRRAGDAGKATPQYVVSVAGAKQYLLSQEARETMAPVAEDTQLFQVIRIDGDTLRYEARTATGRLYDAFSLVGDRATGRRIIEHTEGRIGQRDCGRSATLKGRTDRCWE